MAPPNLATLSPVSLNGTILAQNDPVFDPAIARDLFRHSGNQYGSAVTKLGATPMVRFATPFLPAYNLIGTKLFKLTSFEFFFAKWADYQKAPGAVHTRYKLPEGGQAAAKLGRMSVTRGGVLMVDVDIVPLSAADGMTNPFAQDTAALPTLGAQPARHTMGPVLLNNVRTNGVKSSTVDWGVGMVGETTDGDLYLRSVIEAESNPTIGIEHGDPVAVLTALGLLGAQITAATRLYFRDIDPNTGAALNTGISVTAAAGSIDPTGCQLRRGQSASAGLTIQPISSDTTSALTVQTGVTMPAA